MSRVGCRSEGVRALVLVSALGGTAAALADVRISEVMYNPPQGGRYQYLELFNDADAPRDLSSWAFTQGVTYTFGAGATLGPREYLVVASEPAALVEAYPELGVITVHGPWGGSLANEGERIRLADASGETVESFAYDDDSPWDFLADGFGASLERLCHSASAGDAANWRAGALPESLDGFGGSPGGPNRANACPPVAPSRPPVYISEIMYHPVLEESLVEHHEFVEIHNAGVETVSLAGWRIAGGIAFAFPPDATIGPGEYRVIAKDRRGLAGIAAYGLDPALVFGEYERELDNGGEKIALIDADGHGVESVTYDDEFPWPLAPDALGAGANWVDPAILPLEDHRYMGHSLERVSFDSPPNDPATWAPSPLDGATPGRANAAARAEPLPIVTALLAAPVGASTGRDPILDGDPVLVQAAFSAARPSGPVHLEVFVEDILRDDEEVLSAVMRDDGTEGDIVPEDGIYSAAVAGQPENTVVRYRILADRGEGLEVVSPRPSDPLDWHVYFVSPPIQTSTPVYHLFIAPVPWARLWSNIQGGRVSGCAESATWNNRERAIFVYDGQVYDCRVRYQGSRWNRTNGRDIPLVRWPFSRPASGPLRALSWRISLPRYARVDGRDELTLNKLTQGCPGYNSGVGYRLFAMAGVPASRTRYVRLHINGGYYHYMMEYERPGEDLMERIHREEAEENPALPPEPVGHLYKSVGCTCDEGPFGWGDQRLLPAFCGHSSPVRYAATYPRKTHEWADHSDLQALIEELHSVWRNGAGSVEAQRVFFLERFDVDLLLDYIAIINWSVPFDDMFQNHFLYQRRSDGKWLMMPWDLDRNFGEWQGPNSSILMGMRGDPSNRSGWWNVVKDSFLRSFREEYEDRLFELNNTLLHPDQIDRLVDLVAAEANPAEAAQAPAGVDCSFTSRVLSFKSFARQRHDIVNRAIASVNVQAGQDQTVFAGTVVEFDASASVPDPSEDVTYTWDNGMTGERPTFAYEEPGVYEVTLTITLRGIAFSDTVVITVLPIPEAAFIEEDGRVVFEAERFWTNERRESENTWWDPASEVAGFSGESYMHAVEIARATFLSRYAGFAPELRFAILFEHAGDYRVWIRAHAPSTRSDSVHVNLNAIERGGLDAQELPVSETEFLWSGNTRRDEPQIVTVPQPGLHFLSVWIRESGVSIDKIVLSQDLEYTPEGPGPAESRLGTPGGGNELFVRGDVNRSGRIDTADAVLTLFHLFGRGPALECEDHGDTDDNGRVDLTDAIGSLNFLLRAGPPPPPPFPAPGRDPTTDDPFGCGDP